MFFLCFFVFCRKYVCFVDWVSFILETCNDFSLKHCEHILYFKNKCIKTKLCINSNNSFDHFKNVRKQYQLQVHCKSLEAEIVTIETKAENLFLKDHASFTTASGKIVLNNNHLDKVVLVILSLLLRS